MFESGVLGKESARRVRKNLVSIAAAAALGASATALSGCAGDDQMSAQYVERPIEQIYSDAWKLINRGDWPNAGRQFDEVERQHPYSVWARRAILMSAFCYYEGNRYTDAIDASSRFIQLHPGNKDVPYAYYLKAISLYEQIADVNHDQGKTEEALTALQDLIQRYPDTEYARDARLKMDLARDHLAGREMTIGRFYLRQGDYIAAINRFRTVIDKYQTTTHAPEALERLTEAYLSLGIVREAQTSAAVLGFNYPGSDWYMDAYNLLTNQNLAPQEDKESWISKAYHAVF
ncbi:MAG: outer membrane protein assembly factor BamD [Alphaproteobacteria bacterium]|nr:outer membrane protein assembly factor BamD [Alphaproteobacteria bacterium]